MLDTKITIRRSSGLWGGVSPETVKRYREELEELKKEIDDFSFLYEHNFFGSTDLKTKLQTEIDQEIKYCLFYDEYRSRQSKPNLGEWVLTRQEDIKPKYGWQKPLGEQWSKTNGRIKAIIQFDRTGMMVKITLEYENDSEHLMFCPKVKPPTVHLKSENTINARVQEFKTEADIFLKAHLYPLYSQYEIELLKQLLCVEG